MLYSNSMIRVFLQTLELVFYILHKIEWVIFLLSFAVLIEEYAK
jgi:hypothetical protein